MEEQLSSAPEEKATMDGFSRIINTYFDPRKVFESLRIKPSWLIPFIILSVVGILSFYIAILPIVENQVITQIESMEQMPEDQKEIAIEKSLQYVKFQGIAVPILTIVVFFVASLVLWFVFNMMGGESTFKRVLAVFSYSSLVDIPAAIVKVPLIFVKKSMEIQTSLAIFLSSELKETFLYKVLSGLDIFTFWKVLLISIGLSVMYRYTMRKSFSAVLIVWVISILLLTGLSTLLGGLFRFG
jgi:hypothetical protein